MKPRTVVCLACMILMIVLAQGCAGPQVSRQLPKFNVADVKVRIDKGFLVNEKNVPFTGMIYALAPNQKDTIEIVGFIKGREHGLWKKFYVGGKLAERRFFDNGKKTGVYKAWWPNGTVKLVYHFKDGETDGNCRAWAADGLLIEDMNYKAGYEVGRQVQYYTDGRIKANYLMINGRRYGLLGTKNCINVADSVFKK